MGYGTFVPLFEAFSFFLFFSFDNCDGGGGVVLCRSHNHIHTLSFCTFCVCFCVSLLATSEQLPFWGQIPTAKETVVLSFGGRFL